MSRSDGGVLTAASGSASCSVEHTPCWLHVSSAHIRSPSPQRSTTYTRRRLVRAALPAASATSYVMISGAVSGVTTAVLTAAAPYALICEHVREAASDVSVADWG
jgi:hypothetical protein